MDSFTTIAAALPLILPLMAGYLLDLLLGDPVKFPHPVKLFGRLIAFSDQQFNKGSFRFLKGMTISIFLIGGTWIVLSMAFNSINHLSFLYYPVATVFVFWGLANKCLISEVLKVDKALTYQGLEAGRQQLSFIVGRDTSDLNPQQIRTALLETLSENLSDGVVAPLFYYALGGAPLMLAYKMTNTLDSMIGYKNDRYLAFGKFTARLDDAANYIPARITALLMALLTWNKNGLQFIFLYGDKHTSPNSGYPESALAGILNCRFGGPNRYHGILVDKPYIGNNNRQLTSTDLLKASKINHLVTLTSVLMIVTIFVFLY